MGKTYQIYKYSTSKGGKYERLYNCWRDMFKRVNPSSTKKCWTHYRNNNITVCQEWYDWDAFADWALSHGYTNNLTLDRIDPLGNYNKDNCQWITKEENLSRMWTTIERKKVRCIELDTVYNSATEAEQKLDITTGSVRRAVNPNHNQKTAGILSDGTRLHWEYV